MSQDLKPALDLADYEPTFGAFFACDACEGQGVVVTGGGRDWDGSEFTTEVKCSRCEGFGTTWIEEGC